MVHSERFRHVLYIAQHLAFGPIGPFLAAKESCTMKIAHLWSYSLLVCEMWLLKQEWTWHQLVIWW